MEILPQPHRGHLWLKLHYSIKAKFTQPAIFRSVIRLTQATITLKQNSIPKPMFCHHQLQANWGACGCFCTCHSNFCGFHREESWMHSLAGKPTMGDTPMPRESLKALDDMLPNWPNLSPPVMALENPCTCCWLWQLSCQLLLPVVTREWHVGKPSGIPQCLMEASTEEGGSEGKAIMFAQVFWS